MIKFYIPNFVKFQKENLQFIQLLKDYPEYFYDNISIGGIYGSFPGCIWNGGRTVQSNYVVDAKAIIELYNSLNIPLRYTFTNCLLEEKHLNDSKCNLIMRFSNNGQNEIIINSEILEKYLRKNFPNFKYISSTTKCITDINKIENEIIKYDLIVLDARHNKNFDLLSKIDTSKLEILINSYCNPLCPYREEHYKSISKSQLIGFPYDGFPAEKCSRAKDFNDALKWDTSILVNDLYDIYFKKYNIENFKLEGRSYPIEDVLNSYYYYMVKPLYIEKIKNKMGQIL